MDLNTSTDFNFSPEKNYFNIVNELLRKFNFKLGKSN